MNVDEEQVKNDWLESEGQFQIKTIAQFYGVYEHLFGLAYFLPRIQLDIKVKQLKFSKKNCEFTQNMFYPNSMPYQRMSMHRSIMETH